MIELRRLAVLLCILPLGIAVGADRILLGPAPAWIKPVGVRPVSDGSRPQAPMRLLLQNRQFRFSATMSEAYIESYVLIQTPQGLASSGAITLPWRPDTDVLTVHKVELLRGDKVIDILANGQTFEVLRRENNLEYLALDGVLTGYIQPNGMEVGDVLHLAFTQQREDKLLGAPEFQITGLDEVTEGRIEVHVSWEKGIPLRWRASDEMKGLKETRSGKLIELSWSANDIGAVEQPKSAPLRFWKERRIDIGFFRSWNEVSAKLAPLYARATTLAADSPLRAEARRIADATPDPVARLEETLKLVQDRVRYVFLGMNDGGLNPASADLTWTRRFGDCKGKSALIIALLDEMGIEAEPVAVNTFAGDVIESRLPMVGMFNHVIVRARIDGRSYWLDGAKNSSWRRTDMTVPNYISGLPLTTPGAGLLPMRAEPLAEPQFETSTRIDASKGIHVPAPFHVELKVRGDAAATLNAQLASLSANELDRWMREYWKSVYGFVTVKTVKAAYDERAGVELLEMDGEAAMDWSGERYTTNGMRLGSNAEFVRKEGPGLDLPYRVEFPVFSRTTQRIMLPNDGKGFSILGKDYDQVVAGTHYFRKSGIESGVFTATASTRSTVAEIPAAEAKLAQRVMNEMYKDKLEIKLGEYKLNDADMAAIRAKEYTRVADLKWRGRLLSGRREWDGAIKDYESVLAIESEKDNYAVMASLGLAYYWKRRYDDARRQFERSLEGKPQNATALRGLGAVALAENKLDESITKLTESLKIEPANDFALSRRARAYVLKGEPDKALADSAEVIRAFPASIDMYQLRADVFTEKGDFTRALQEADELAKANPDNADALVEAAFICSLLGKTKEALALMDRAIGISPEGSNYLTRANLRERTDFAARLADVDAALAKSPQWGYAMLAKGRIQSESQDHVGAIASYTQAAKAANIGRWRLEVLTRRGIEYSKTGQKAAAQKDFAAALGDKPEAVDYNNFCWELAIARTNLDRALAACERAVALEPKNAASLDSKAFVLMQLGRLNEAIATYDAALAIRPKAAASLFVRGIARNRKCGCRDGDEDIATARRLQPRVDEQFALAGVSP